MLILGLSHLEPSPFGHDSTVALLEDGILRAAISEERFSRIKHDGGIPSNAIKYCLNKVNTSFSDIDKITVGFGLEEKYVGDSFKQFSFAKKDLKFKSTKFEQKDNGQTIVSGIIRKGISLKNNLRLSFEINKTFKPSLLFENSTDERSLGFSYRRITFE